MRGVLRFKGALRFDGNFQGEIETNDTLIIGNTGTIEAKIDTGSLFNMGQIVGNVKAARKVSIFSDSNLTGNIDTPVFVAEEGAIFKGNCVMPSTPPKKYSSKDISVKSGALAKDYQTYLPKTEGIPGISIGGKAGKGGGRKGGWAAIAVLLLVLIAVPLGYFAWVSVSKIGDHPIQRMMFEKFAIKKNDAVKLKLIGYTYFRENRYAKAAEIFKMVRGLLPNDLSILNNLAVAVEKSGRMKEAIGYYEKVLKTDSGNRNLIKKLDGYYSAEGQTEKRIELYEYVTSGNSADMETSKLLYTLYNDNNLVEKALNVYRNKLADSPSTIDNLLTIGRMEKKLDRLNEAIQTFSEAVKLDNGKLESRIELAYANHKAGYEHRAVEEFSAIGRIDPDHLEEINNNGFAQLSRGNTEKAVELFNTALTENPGNLRSYLGLATTYSRIGDWSKAEYYCKRILEIDPNYSPALNRLAWTYAQTRQNLDEAERYSLASMRYSDDLPDYIDTLSEIYYREKNYDKAIEMIERAISFNPRNKYFKSQLNKFQAAKKRAEKSNR